MLIIRFPFFFNKLLKDDDFVFGNDVHGSLIKIIEDILPSEELFVKGTKVSSRDSFLNNFTGHTE